MANETTRTETITVTDGSFEGHLVVPISGSGPGVLLLQEIFGLSDFMTQKAADLAALGYVVLAPDVFWRIEPNVALAHDEDGLRQAFEYVGRYMAEVDTATKSADLVAALEHLKALPEVVGRKVAVMGYCLGGFLAYLTAAEGDPDTCVSYYGSGIADQLALANRITCPILFHFGGNDPYIPNEQVARITEAFSQRDDVTVRVEPDAGHAFENLHAPQFGVGEAAARSFAATDDWLAEHLS
ncbi:MAG: dienelactone hydrolase family protein [Acidimicrobiales bacterium]|jgi:carboxymethylenebutenolidase